MFLTKQEDNTMLKGTMSRIARTLLVLSLLSLPLTLSLSVPRVEADIVDNRRIPVSLCTSSREILLVSGIVVPLQAGDDPNQPAIFCPITEDLPDVFPKSAVDLMRVAWFGTGGVGRLVVNACSQQFDDPGDVVCVYKNLEMPVTGHRFVDFTIGDLVPAWGPARANALGFVQIGIPVDSSGTPHGAVTGILLFTDRGR
jgi:hypothetical protein